MDDYLELARAYTYDEEYIIAKKHFGNNLFDLNELLSLGIEKELFLEWLDLQLAMRIGKKYKLF